MIVVSDTGPINYLLLIGRINLLNALFQQVVLPRAVFEELTNSGASNQVRDWASNPPNWVTIRAPKLLLVNVSGARGELEAISLAKELHTALLCDDEQARRIARREGLAVSGTLGVLIQGHARNLLDITEVLDKLVKETNFYVSESVLDRVRNEAIELRHLNS